MSQRGISKAYMPLLLSIVAILIVVLQFGFLFLLLALLPAMMAYFVDNHEGKPIFKTVLACNFTGALPSLVPLMKSGTHDISGIIANPRVWLFVYGGAAAGWGLIYLCRFIAHFILIIHYEYKVLSLERFQKKLIEEWGQQVAGPPSLKN